MFSLIITIVSIALVAALAIATIYYGGDVFGKASARASAAAVVSQGQQILSAVHIFRAHTGRWPTDLDELVSSSYLKNTPDVSIASANTSLVNIAHAADASWETVQAGRPYYWIHQQIPVEQCQQLNLLVRGDNGIFNAAKPSLPIQCFGSNANYTVLVSTPGTNPQDIVDAVTDADPGLSVDESGGGYAVPPTVTAPVGDGGEPAEPTAPPPLSFQNPDGSPLSSVSFPSTSVGSNSAPTQVTLKNTSASTLTFNSPAVLTSAPFSIGSTTCAGTLAPEATCTVSVTFSPAAAQTYSGSLTTDSSVAPSVLPLTGTGTMTGVQQIVLGNHFTFVQKENGTWVAAGDNRGGLMGLGDEINRISFTPVPALAGATQVVAGAFHTFAKLADGTWVAAGQNYSGQLGLASTFPHMTYTPVPALNGARQVILGRESTFAQAADGTWMAAGYNNYGQLGLGDNVNRFSFTPVPSLAGATRLIVVDASRAFAQFPDGTWAGSGYNNYGQLGTGDTVTRYTFDPIPALTGATEVAAAGSHAFAKLGDGSWAAVGLNNYGQLGLGDNATRLTFTPVPALVGASQVVTGGHHVYAKLANGSWAATGYNNFYQLAQGHQVDRNVFTPVASLAGATSVYSGTYHIVARFADGRLAGTGSNSYGQLGKGNTTISTYFTTITP